MKQPPEYTIAELSSLERVQAEAEKRLGMFRPQPDNMVALLYEPQAEVTEVALRLANLRSSLKKDYQFISSILTEWELPYPLHMKKVG